LHWFGLGGARVAAAVAEGMIAMGLLYRRRWKRAKRTP
jgi:hypothetical protein